MAVYYPGPDVRVTDRAFEVMFPPRSYPLEELQQVCIAAREVRKSVSPRVIAFSVALVAIVALAFAFYLGGVPLAASTMIAGLACAVSGWLPRRPTRQLWAKFHGRNVCLFESSNDLVFGQVKRALGRALEQHVHT